MRAVAPVPLTYLIGQNGQFKTLHKCKGLVASVNPTYKQTSRYHSVMLIHDSLHSRAVQLSPLRYICILKSARILANPLPAVLLNLYRDLIPLWFCMRHNYEEAYSVSMSGTRSICLSAVETRFQA